MLLDVIQRLKMVQFMSPYTVYPSSAYSTPPIDLKKVDVILYDLGNKLRMLSTDNYARMKQDMIRGNIR